MGVRNIYPRPSVIGGDFNVTRYMNGEGVIPTVGTKKHLMI